MKSLALVLVPMLLCVAQGARADTRDEVDQLLALSMEDLLATKVRISTLTEKPLSKAPAVVSVITAEDIKATGATNFIDALQGVPGLYVRNNLASLRPWIHMRGSGVSSNTLIMVNGSSIKEFISVDGQYWKGLPAGIIDRIEIIRGPGSALYGADAAAGVINVITKTASGIGASEAGVRIGSFDSQTAWVQHGANWNGFDVALTAELSRTEGYNPLIARDNSASHISGQANYGYDNADIRFSLAQGSWRLLADHQQKSNVGIGMNAAAVLDPRTRGSDSHTELALLYANAAFAPDWGIDAEMRYRNITFSSGDGYYDLPPAGAYPEGKINRQRGAEDRFNLEVSALYSGFRDHALRFGTGYVMEDQYRVDNHLNYNPANNTALPAGTWYDASDTVYAFLPKKARANRYLFLQDVWSIADAWEGTLGGRFDDYSDFGNAFNPRAALVWQTTDRLTAKLMYGTAFRAPSFLELYSQVPGNAQGNSSLKPERSKTRELAFSYLASHDLRLGLNHYQLTQSDLIVTGVASYQNAGTLVASGIELEAHWQATPALRFSGTLSDRHDDLSRVIQEPSYRPPQRQAYLRTDWKFLPGWTWNLQANRLGKHLFKNNESVSQPIGAYTVADTTLRYQHDRQWEFAASVRNLFNTDAREYVPSNRLTYNLPLPGRSFWAEVRYKF